MKTHSEAKIRSITLKEKIFKRFEKKVSPQNRLKIEFFSEMNFDVSSQARIFSLLPHHHATQKVVCTCRKATIQSALNSPDPGEAF